MKRKTVMLYCEERTIGRASAQYLMLVTEGDTYALTPEHGVAMQVPDVVQTNRSVRGLTEEQRLAVEGMCASELSDVFAYGVTFHSAKVTQERNFTLQRQAIEEADAFFKKVALAVKP